MINFRGVQKKFEFTLIRKEDVELKIDGSLDNYYKFNYIEGEDDFIKKCHNIMMKRIAIG